MLKNLLHLALMIGSMVLALLFARYAPPLTSALVASALLLWCIVASYAVTKVHRRIQQMPTYLLESVVATFVIHLIVFISGGEGSPLYFLLLLYTVVLAFFLPLFVVLSFSLINVLFFIGLAEPYMYTQIFIFLQFEVSLVVALLLKDIQEARRKKPAATLSGQAKVIKDDVYYFFSLIAKEHFATIRKATQEFTGDHHLKVIDKAVHELEKLFRTIEKKS